MTQVTSKHLMYQFGVTVHYCCKIIESDDQQQAFNDILNQMLPKKNIAGKGSSSSYENAICPEALAIHISHCNTALIAIQFFQAAVSIPSDMTAILCSNKTLQSQTLEISSVISIDCCYYQLVVYCSLYSYYYCHSHKLQHYFLLLLVAVIFKSISHTNIFFHYYLFITVNVGQCLTKYTPVVL